MQFQQDFYIFNDENHKKDEYSFFFWCFVSQNQVTELNISIYTRYKRDRLYCCKKECRFTTVNYVLLLSSHLKVTHGMSSLSDFKKENGATEKQKVKRAKRKGELYSDIIVHSDQF